MNAGKTGNYLRLVIPCLLVLLARPACAFEWQQNFSSLNYLQFFSNPLYLPNPKPVSVADWTPTYGLTGQSEAYSLKAVASANLMRSSDPTVMVNRADPSLTVTAAYTGQTTTLSAAFAYSQMTTLPLGVSPVELGQNSYAAADGTRISRTATLTWQQELSDLWSLNTSLISSSIGFNQPGVNQVQQSGFLLTSYAQNQLQVKLTRTLSPVLSAYAMVHAGSMTVPSESGQDTWYEVDAGSQWNLSDAWSLNGYAGVNRTQNTLVTTLVPATSTTGLSASLSLQRQLEGNLLSLLASQTEQGSAYGGVVQTDMVTANWSKALTDLYQLGADGFYLQSKTVYQIRQVMADAWISRDLTAAWNLKLQIQRVEWMPTGASAVGDNVVGLYLVYSGQ